MIFTRDPDAIRRRAHEALACDLLAVSVANVSPVYGRPTRAWIGWLLLLALAAVAAGAVWR